MKKKTSKKKKILNFIKWHFLSIVVGVFMMIVCLSSEMGIVSSIGASILGSFIIFIPEMLVWLYVVKCKPKDYIIVPNKDPSSRSHMIDLEWGRTRFY